MNKFLQITKNIINIHNKKIFFRIIIVFVIITLLLNVLTFLKINKKDKLETSLISKYNDYLSIQNNIESSQTILNQIVILNGLKSITISISQNNKFLPNISLPDYERKNKDKINLYNNNSLPPQDFWNDVFGFYQTNIKEQDITLTDIKIQINKLNTESDKLSSIIIIFIIISNIMNFLCGFLFTIMINKLIDKQ